MNSRLDEMGLMTERAHYAVALVDLADADESACGALQKMLEQFRGEQFSFESLVLKEQGRLGVLICFDYGDQAQDAREALEDMCSAADIHTTLRMGTIVDALADIPDSLMAAISDGRQDTRQRYEALDCDAQIRRLCRAIRMRSADSVRVSIGMLFVTAALRGI